MSDCKCGIGKPHGENGIPYDVPLFEGMVDYIMELGDKDDPEEEK
jgi:hypothetical protein